MALKPAWADNGTGGGAAKVPPPNQVRDKANPDAGHSAPGSLS